MLRLSPVIFFLKQFIDMLLVLRYVVYYFLGIWILFHIRSTAENMDGNISSHLLNSKACIRFHHFMYMTHIKYILHSNSHVLKL